MLNLSRVCTGRLFWLSILSILTVPGIAVAESSHILIIAVQIAGDNASDDFIKLYNPTDEDIFLGDHDGSYLRLVKRTKNSGKDYSIKSWSKDATAKIPAKGYLLWASSKNASFPSLINADSQTSQTLSQNNGVALRTGPENTGQIVDSVGWGNFNNVLFEAVSFALNPEAEQVLLRKENNGAYQDTNDNQNDFYLSLKNHLVATTESPDVPAQTEKEAAQIVQNDPLVVIPQNNNILYPNGIVFSEILPAPDGPDDTEEWIELFNKNDFNINLSEWRIKDAAGAVKTYILPKNSTINGKEYLIIKRPDSKITLNNDGDAIELIKPDGVVADQINFGKSKSGASFNLTESDWQWSVMITPGKENIIQAIDNKNNNAAKELTKPDTEKSLASIKQPFQNINNFPAATLFAALSLAIISGAGILFLKRRISDKT